MYNLRVYDEYGGQEEYMIYSLHLEKNEVVEFKGKKYLCTGYEVVLVDDGMYPTNPSYYAVNRYMLRPYTQQQATTFAAMDINTVLKGQSLSVGCCNV